MDLSATYRRYAIYAVPQGEFYAVGAAWLGWDCETGRAVARPEITGLPNAWQVAEGPRNYGFHGTIVAPFRLCDAVTETTLAEAFAAFCDASSAIEVPRLEVRRLGGFVAVVPVSPSGALCDLAADAVRAFAPMRAPLSEAELAKRRKGGLRPRQEELLALWGYPHVMELFRFHLTLTGRLSRADAELAQAALAEHFAPVLPTPFPIESLCLMGEDDSGAFHVIARRRLAG